jgi:20S proteasome alpha/beta subunit
MYPRPFSIPAPFRLQRRKPKLVSGPRGIGMTLIIGLKQDDSVVIGAEQEETGGIAAKRVVTKLRLVAKKEWAVVVGGAGDAAIAENALREMERRLLQNQKLTEQILLDVTDAVLDSVYTKYIDKDKDNEGLSLIVGAISDDGLHLLSTQKRVPQPQDSIAYAGYGADIGIFFLDRLHDATEDWTYAVTVAGFALQQAIQACRFCSGESEIYVLQKPPNPRWRSLGTADASTNFQNSFQKGTVALCLETLVRREQFDPNDCAGYSDEHHPEPIPMERLSQSVSQTKEPKEREGH